MGIALKSGGLAQLARAFDWQSKGQRFDSAILHKSNKETCSPYFFIRGLYKLAGL